MTYKTAYVGQRVRLHPATDWFMRGAVYATITSKQPTFVRVKLERIGPSKLRPRIAYRDLMTEDGEATE